MHPLPSAAGAVAPPGVSAACETCQLAPSCTRTREGASGVDSHVQLAVTGAGAVPLGSPHVGWPHTPVPAACV